MRPQLHLNIWGAFTLSEAKGHPSHASLARGKWNHPECQETEVVPFSSLPGTPSCLMSTAQDGKEQSRLFGFSHWVLHVPRYTDLKYSEVGGGAAGDRTPGLDSAIVALSQLSYCPIPLRIFPHSVALTILKHTRGILTQRQAPYLPGAWRCARLALAPHFLWSPPGNFGTP